MEIDIEELKVLREFMDEVYNELDQIAAGVAVLTLAVARNYIELDKLIKGAESGDDPS